MEPKRMLFVKSQRILGSLGFLKDRSHARSDFASPLPDSNGHESIPRNRVCLDLEDRRQESGSENSTSIGAK